MNFRKELDLEVKKYLQEQTDAERSDILIEHEALLKNIEETLDAKISREIKKNIRDFIATVHLLFTLDPTIFGDNENTIEVSCLSGMIHIQAFIKSLPQYTSEAEWNRIIHGAILQHLKQDNQIGKFNEEYELL